jgi:hypothetical protein
MLHRAINGHAGCTSWIDAASPRSLPPAAIRAAIAEFAEKTRYDVNGDPDPVTWNGDVMIRTFPLSSEGPAYQMATAKETPDGNHVLLSVSCYNTGWFEACSRAMTRVIGDVESGQMQERLAPLLSSRK